MFPVTIESHDGRLQTYATACYGFLRDYEWEDNDYSFCDGWNRLITYPYRPSTPTEPFGRNCLWHYGNTHYSQNPRIDLNEAKHIWNSGSVLPYVGLSQSGNAHIAFQSEGSSLYYAGETTPEKIDNVERWSREKGISYTRREFLTALENYVDKDQESAIVWDSRGFMGVRTDIPADRSLFYLMIDRELWDLNNYKKTSFILNQIHDKGRNPMIAFLMSRLVSIITGAFGDEFYYCGNSHDGCILPDSLIVKGLGAKYESPTSIPWFQQAYVTGNGHMRDEDIDDEDGDWEFNHDDYSQRVSASLFNSVFQLSDDGNNLSLKGSSEPAVPLKVLFAKALLPEEEYQRRQHRFWDLGDLLEDIEEDGDLQIPKDQWEEKVYNLLMSIEQ